MPPLANRQPQRRGLVVARYPLSRPMLRPSYSGPLFKGFVPDEIVLNIMRFRVPASPSANDVSFLDFLAHPIGDYQRYMRDLAVSHHYEAMANEVFFKNYRHLHIIHVQGPFSWARDSYDPKQSRFKSTPIPPSYCAKVEKLHIDITVQYHGGQDDAVLRETIMRLEGALILYTSVRRVLITVDTAQPIRLSNQLDRHILKTVFDVLGPAMESKKRRLSVCMVLRHDDGLSSVFPPSTVAFLYAQGEQGWNRLQAVLVDVGPGEM